MASLRWAMSASALETSAAARAAFASASMRAARSMARSHLRLFQIVRQVVNWRCHDWEWSTDRVIRDLGIGQMSQNATGSSNGFRLPCALRMSPVNALQHIGELRRRDDNDAT